MKLYSWNVNGFRAVVKKGFWDWFYKCGGDVICLQEIKAHPDQLDEKNRSAQGYEVVWNPARLKKGYSGVASFYRVSPLKISFGLPESSFQGEGRLILMEFEKFFLFNVYFPNGQMSEERLQFKLQYYDEFLNYAQSLS